MAVSRTERTVSSGAHDELDLFVQSWRAEDSPSPPSAHLLLLHGYLEHSGRYAELAESLCASVPGLTVTTYDQRGHGKSGGARAVVRDWTKEFLTDLDTVVAGIKKESGPDTKLFLMGHSNGGLQVLDYLLHDHHNLPTQSTPWTGVVISSPFLAPADELPWIKVMASKVLGRFLPSMTIPTTLPVEHLTSDKTKQEEHGKDDLILKDISVGWGYQGLLAQQRVKKTLKDDILNMKFPLFFAYAAEDRVADPILNEQTAAKMESKLSKDQVTTVRREGNEHEIFMEADRHHLFELLAEWIRKHCE